jgi:predicted metal-binding protein
MLKMMGPGRPYSRERGGAAIVIGSDGVDALMQSQSFPDFRWISGRDVVVEQWVRFKCTFACEEFGRNACCPPNTPGVAECRELFLGYERIAVIHLQAARAEGEDPRIWKREVNGRFLELERAAFLAGFYKALALFPGDCSLCAECVPSRADCRNSGSARPVPEALAVDVYATVRKLGFPIHVLTDRSQTMNRYGFLLLE